MTKVGQAPTKIADCKVGDSIAMSVDTATKRIAVFKNGVAVGWLPGPIPPVLYPHASMLPAGYVLKQLTPVAGPTPPTPPPPPPPPPAADVLVGSVTVELFGAMPRFGAYVHHKLHQKT